MFKILMTIVCLTIPCLSVAADTTVTLSFAKDGNMAGTISIRETPYGLLFIPNLEGLSPGIHGFHVHEHPDCQQAGQAAGGHFDPQKTGSHLGPYNDEGHLGDLPALFVDSNGKSTLPVLAPRINKIAEIKNRSLIVHEGGDNYSDLPKKLGGGGDRVLCGKIP